MKISELCPNESILGISREGKTSWSPMDIVKTKQGRMTRLTTDSSETLLAPNCEIFTVEGIKQVSAVSLGELVETANIPTEILEMLDKKVFQSIQVDDYEIKLDEKTAYVIGAQIRSRRFPFKVVFDQIDPEKAPLLARLCSDIRKTSGIGGKIFYVKGGRRIRFDSWILAEVCGEMWKTNKVSAKIRESPAGVMHAFVVGMLDMILQKNSAETPPTFFSTASHDSELRRFILNVLRIYGVIPPRMSCVTQQDGSTSFRSSINTSDLEKLGLRFIRAMKIPPALQETKAISYSAVKNILHYRGTLCSLSTSESHWSPIVDLTPLHRHTFQL